MGRCWRCNQPNLEVCPKCIYKKGKGKGTHPVLIIKETNTFTCNCPWNQFTVIQKGDEEDGDTEE